MNIAFCRIHGETGLVSRYKKHGILFTLLQCGCKKKEVPSREDRPMIAGSENILDFLGKKLPDAQIKTNVSIDKEGVIYTPEIGRSIEDQIENIALNEVEKKINAVTEESIKGQTVYPYQAEGIQFLERNNGRCLILDEMGLGKTIQALLYIRRNKKYPCIIFCKPSLIMNWYKECINWVGTGHLPCIIKSGKIYNNFDIYICSIDMAFKKRDEIARLGIQCMIIDELQNMKNMEAKRTYAIRKIAEIGNGKGDEIPHIVGLTGTPIKNRAPEFYPALNMVRPDLFPTEADFYRTWTRIIFVRDETRRGGGTQKIGGIKNLDEFKEYTRDVCIRRLRKDVLPDLPRVARDNRFVDMSQGNKQVYARAHEKLVAFMKEKADKISFGDYSTILSFITQMRQITAIAKVDYAIEYIEEFLESSDSKITVFTHHHLAIDLLIKSLQKRGIKYLRYKSKDDYFQIEEFNRPDTERLLLASTLSAGEGLNLQYQCHNCLFMERQWNPANEEQAEGRFTRIGSVADKVIAAYLVAIGTIDEWMTDIIEFKRVSGNLDKEGEYFQDETTLAIARKLVEKGLPKWRLPRL